MTSGISYEPYEPADCLAALEERHFWFRSRRRIVIDAFRHISQTCAPTSKLGAAPDTLRAGSRGFSGMPSGRVRPSFRRRRFAHRWRCIFRSPDAFDVVGAYDVLEHIADDRGALGQFRKACRPGGGVLLTVPQHAWLWSPADTYAHHHRRYGRQDLLARFRDGGFEILGSTSFHSLNLPLSFLRSRFLGVTGRDPEASHPAAPVNWLLESEHGM